MMRFYYLVGTILVGSVLFSCNINYVKVADVQQEFKLINEKITNESLKLDNQLDDSKQLLVTYKVCSDTAKNIQRSNKLLGDVSNSVSQLKGLKSQSEQEYSTFLGYTNGKTIIVDKMPEWQKIEQTRKNLTSASATWDSKNSLLIKQNDEFKKFVNDTLVPSVVSQNTSDYFSKLNTDVTVWETKISNSTRDFTTLKSSVLEKIKKYKILFPDVVKKIETELNGIQSKYDGLLTPITDYKKTVSDFKNKTQSYVSVYNCQKEWAEMISIKSKLTDVTSKVQILEKEIKDKTQILDALLAKLK